MITPYHWQEPSVAKMVEVLRNGNFCINASDTGTGKTVTALAALKQLGGRALIVCPKIVHTAWLRTAEEMACRDQIYGIVNPERLQYSNPYFVGNTWRIPKSLLIIWDEVHRGASGPKATTTKILALTRPLGYKVLAMSATIASSPLQMRAIGYLAGLHQFKPSSYWEWCRANGCFHQDPIPGLRFPKGPRARAFMEQIGRQLQPVMTRIRIADVPDFPETLIQANLYDLETTYAQQIKDAWDNLREALREERSDELTERLRAREITELCKVALLSDLAREAIEEAGKSVVVFVNFRSTLAALQDKLGKFKPHAIYGGQTDAERQLGIAAFQADDCPLMLCMSQAGGLGIDLHGLPGKRERISFITPSDKATDFIQCLGRIHRSGGSKTIQTVVLAAGTVEEKIHTNLQGKLSNLSALQDGDLTT